MPQSQSLSTPPRDLACLKADALYKLWNAPKHSLPPTILCRIVIFYLTSIHFVQNCHLPPYIHPLLRSDGRSDLFVHYTTAGSKGLRFCAELSSSTSRPSTIPHRIVIFYRWSIDNSVQNCRLLPLVHFTTAGRQVRAMVVKYTVVVVARNGAQEGRCPQSRSQGTRKACYSTWFVCFSHAFLHPSSVFSWFGPSQITWFLPSCTYRGSLLIINSPRRDRERENLILNATSCLVWEDDRTNRGYWKVLLSNRSDLRYSMKPRMI